MLERQAPSMIKQLYFYFSLYSISQLLKSLSISVKGRYYSNQRVLQMLLITYDFLLNTPLFLLFE